MFIERLVALLRLEAGGHPALKYSAIDGPLPVAFGSTMKRTVQT